MKNLIIIIALFIATSAFAVDTDLGKIVLTPNQLQHLSDITGVKGVSYHEDGTVIAVSDSPLTDSEKSDVITQLHSLSNTKPVKPKSIEDRLSVLEDKVSVIEEKTI